MTLKAQSAAFSYSPHKRVLDTVSFEPGPGITCVIGPNGAGKSTLLRLLLGVLRPTGGSVTLDGRPVHRFGAAARAARVAYIPQRPEVSAAFTARQCVELGRFALGPAQDAVNRAMEKADILDQRHEMFAQLSAGQQQRVALARALAQLDPAGRQRPDPRYLLADEPMSAMDPAHVQRCERVLRELGASGVRVVLVLHDLTVAARLASSALVLSDRGRVLAHGPVADALSNDNLRAAFGVPFERLGSGRSTAVVPVPAAPGLME